MALNFGLQILLTALFTKPYFEDLLHFALNPRWQDLQKSTYPRIGLEIGLWMTLNLMR